MKLFNGKFRFSAQNCAKDNDVGKKAPKYEILEKFTEVYRKEPVEVDPQERVEAYPPEEPTTVSDVVWKKLEINSIGSTINNWDVGSDYLTEYLKRYAAAPIPRCMADKDINVPGDVLFPRINSVEESNNALRPYSSLYMPQTDDRGEIYAVKEFKVYYKMGRRYPFKLVYSDLESCIYVDDFTEEERENLYRTSACQIRVEF